MCYSAVGGLRTGVQTIFTRIIFALLMQQSATQIIYRHRYIDSENTRYVQFVKTEPTKLGAESSNYFRGRLATLEELQHDILFEQEPNYMYRHPDIYYPHCLQVLKRFTISRKDCQLPIECGITMNIPMKHGWISSEDVCLGIMTTQYPNVTTTKEEQHLTHWADAFYFKLPNAYKFHRLSVVLDNYVLLRFGHGTYQVVSKRVLETIPKYDTAYTNIIPPTTIITGLGYCIHRVKPQHQLVFAESTSPYLAMLASNLFIYPDTELCPTGNKYYSIVDGMCEYKYDSRFADFDCFVECSDIDVIRCDPDQDDWSPPSMVQTKLIASVLWIARIITTMFKYLWNSIIKMLTETYYYLDRTWYITEYSLLFTIAVIYLKGWVPALALVLLTTTIFGINRYGGLDQ